MRAKPADPAAAQEHCAVRQHQWRPPLGVQKIRVPYCREGDEALGGRLSQF